MSKCVSVNFPNNLWQKIENSINSMREVNQNWVIQARVHLYTPGTRTPKYPFLWQIPQALGLPNTHFYGKTWPDLRQSRQLPGGAKESPRTSALVFVMTNKVAARSSCLITDLCISHQNKAQTYSSLITAATKKKAGCKAWKHGVFPSSSTSASLLSAKNK